MNKKEEIIQFFLEKGFLVNPSFINNINENFDKETFLSKLYNLEGRPRVLDGSIFGLIDGKISSETQNVEIIKSYQENLGKKDVQGFVNYFRSRYFVLKKILLNRPELQEAISISKVVNKRERETVSLVGLITKKEYTKNNNISIILEDVTGVIPILINKNKPELYNLAKDLVLDEVIGVKGIVGNRIVFINEIYFPDVPTNKDLKKCNDDVYVAFISDIHMGLYAFLSEDFSRFLNWLNGDTGDERQKELAKKVKYLFIVGDLVEGVGVYPNHERDLVIKDIYEQYKRLADYLKLIPKHIKIIVCGGNHDALRIAEPQPILYKDIAAPLWNLPNVTITTNPALVRIHSSKEFPGFDVLIYHGFSIPYFANSIDSIRMSGGQNKIDSIMKFLLQRRHLAPTYMSTLYIPGNEDDPLLIDKVPDFFVTGHIHKVVATNYKNISLICAGCWVSGTPYQERRGIIPEPSKVVLASLKTREFKILNFGK
ncbi:MAG: metallophosphoesterase [Nanoarchaeota archaeon]